MFARGKRQQARADWRPGTKREAEFADARLIGIATAPVLPYPRSE
jgi:hypothetical protein